MKKSANSPNQNDAPQNPNETVQLTHKNLGMYVARIQAKKVPFDKTKLQEPAFPLGDIWTTTETLEFLALQSFSFHLLLQHHALCSQVWAGEELLMDASQFDPERHGQTPLSTLGSFPDGSTLFILTPADRSMTRLVRLLESEWQNVTNGVN
jgi:hypothetical protein